MSGEDSIFTLRRDSAHQFRAPHSGISPSLSTSFSSFDAVRTAGFLMACSAMPSYNAEFVPYLNEKRARSINDVITVSYKVEPKSEGGGMG